tara:strand:- start:736 stop:942 length:207 start_codon:yes stop_codon:yes gene_type:complete
MIYKGDFTYREMILILAKKCMEENLVTDEDLQQMSNSKRNYHRIRRALKTPNCFINADGREVYLGEQC